MRRAPWKSLVGPVMVLIAVVLLANVVAFAAWTAPRWSARLGVVAAASVDDARQRIEPSLTAARGTYGHLSEAEDDLAAFRERIVTTVGAAELLAMFDAVGEDVGIDLDDATPQYVPIDELGVVQLGMTFPVTGTYAAVRRLLDELLALPVFLVIDGVGLQSFGASSAGGGEMLEVDLAVSVFLDDPELASDAFPTPDARPAVPPERAAHVTALRRAVAGNDPGDIADAVLAGLEALPPLPVEPSSLIVEDDRLAATTARVEPGRNLFSVVLPPAPEPAVPEQQPETLAEPEPQLPVRLIGLVMVEGRWHASLTDELQVFIVEPGDELDNGVTVVDVGEDYAELSFRDQTTVLRLEGTRP